MDYLTEIISLIRFDSDFICLINGAIAKSGSNEQSTLIDARNNGISLFDVYEALMT
jgi:hypothetical protein